MKGGLAADSQALRAAISAAGVAGQLFVAAAGNDYGTNIDLDGGTPTFPVRSFFSLSPSLSRLRGKKTSEEKKKLIFFPSPTHPPFNPPLPPPPPHYTPPPPPPPPPKKKKGELRLQDRPHGHRHRQVRREDRQLLQLGRHGRSHRGARARDPLDRPRQ